MDRTWFCSGKDHTVGDASVIDGFAVALEDSKNEWLVYVATATSTPSAVPAITATLPNGYTITGGGAVVRYAGWGQMLTASMPEGIRSWTAKAKQHGPADPESVTAYVIGIQPRNGTSMPQSVVSSVAVTSPRTPPAP